MKKKRITQISFIVVCMMLLSLLGGGTSVAEEPEPEQGPIATVTIAAGVISWEPQVENDGLVLTISGPGDFYLRQEYESGARPTFTPEDSAGNLLPDGVYKYELQLVPVVREALLGYDESQRGIVPMKGPGKAPVQSGSFSILNGGFVTRDVAEIAEDGKFAKLLSPDILHYDDVIITGSLCTGFDCQDGENFGFDTIRLKENNLRIKFEDTSTTAGFATNDWQITANDSASGGANKFSIDDISSGKTPFTIEAGAPSNSLYVEDYGRIGIKTSTPVVELHIKDSDTPTVRLEQDSSGGWTPQTWDVAGNESNFFIRDTTNGSKLPFRIQPNTPTNTLCLKSDGKVGIGTWSPEYPLELETTGQNAQFKLERTDGASGWIAAGANSVNIGSVSNHNLGFLVNNTWRMRLNTDGTLNMADGGSYNGTWNPASSREYKENIRNLAADEAMDALEGLSPVRFNYKNQEEEDRLGFIAEEVPDLVAMNGRKTLSTMDIVAVLTKVVQEQQKIIEELEAQNATLEARLTALEKAVGASHSP